MRDSERPCYLIQEDIAWGRGVSPEDRAHALSCGACSEIAVRFEEIDSLVSEVSGQEVPAGFADRVVAAIEKEQIGSGPFISRLFPAMEGILYSRSVQWALVGFGAILGLLKIFNFIVNIWIQA